MNIFLLLTSLFLQPVAFAEECKIERIDHKCLLRVWPMSGGEDILWKEWKFEVPIDSGDCYQRPYYYEKFTVPNTELNGDVFISARKYRMEFWMGAEKITLAAAEFPWTRESRVSHLSGSHNGKYFTLMCGTQPWPW